MVGYGTIFRHRTVARSYSGPSGTSKAVSETILTSRHDPPELSRKTDDYLNLVNTASVGFLFTTRPTVIRVGGKSFMLANLLSMRYD